MNENKNNRDAVEEKDGSIIVKNSKGSIHCMSIIGQIEGHYISPENQKATKYEHIIPLLAAIEESEEIDGLLMLLFAFSMPTYSYLPLLSAISTATAAPVFVITGLLAAINIGGAIWLTLKKKRENTPCRKS